MRTIRIYQNTPMIVSDTMQLQGSAAHHIQHVLRLNVGMTLVLVNGDEHEYDVSIRVSTKKHVLIYIENKRFRPTHSQLSIHLAQAVSKTDRMDVSLQKAVELGVSEITPLFSDYSEHFTGERLEKKQQHWQNIIISAAEQCERTELPILHPAQALKKWLPQIQSPMKLLADPDQSTIHLKQIETKPASCVILIGAEGGFSPDEIDAAKIYAFYCWQWGRRVLRTETATMTAISLLQWEWGDFSS